MRARGFTLLEVIASLVIFATAAVVLAAGYVNVLNAYEAARQGRAHAEDIRFARAQLLAEADHDNAEKGGDFDVDGGRLRWHAKIEPTDTADLFQVTFICEIDDQKATQDTPPVTETFMLLRPTWSEGADATKLRQEAKDRILELQQKRTP